MEKLVKTIVVVLTALTAANLAQAGEVISFAVNSSTPNDENLSGLVDGNDMRLRVQNRYWNNLTQPTGGSDQQTVTPPETFVDETGAMVEGMTFTGTAYGKWSWNATSAFGAKGSQYVDGPWSVKITGVPFASYDLVLYMATDNSNLAWGAVGIGDAAESETFTYYSPSSENPSEAVTVESTATWGQTTPSIHGYRKDVIRIRNLTNPTLSFTTVKDSGNLTRAGLFGFQIVQTKSDKDVCKYDLTGTPETTALSQLTNFPSDAAAEVRIILADGATFTVDGTPTLASLAFKSAGSVTIAASESAMANIAAMTAGDVSGTATLAYTTDSTYTASKLYDFDVVNLSAGTLSLTENFVGQQLIVSGGSVTIDAALNASVATTETPMTVTGQGSTLKLVGTGHQKNRAPNGGTIRAEKGATLEIEGVNLFADGAGRPFISVDGATFLVDAYAGSHMKVGSVTLANDAALTIAGTKAAYASQALIIDNGSSAQLTVASGTGNTVGYAEGATENVILIATKIIEVAESAKLTADVAWGNDLIKTGAGELEMPAARAKNTEIVAGTLFLTGVSGDLAQTFSGAGMLDLELADDTTVKGSIADTLTLSVTGRGHLNLGKSRPMITTIPGGTILTVTPTDAELEAGRIVLPLSDNVTLTQDSLVVTDDEGFSLDGDGKTITLSTGIPIWKASTGAWTRAPEAGKSCIIDFTDASEATTCTWTVSGSPAFDVLYVKGSGTVAVTGSTLSFTGIHFPDDAAAAVSFSTQGQINVSGAISGAASVTWTSGAIVQANTSVIATTYTGALTLAGGYWQWGNAAGNINASTAIGQLGSSVTVRTGAQLTIHPWTTGGLQGKDKDNKVKFTAPLVLEGGKVYFNDGSYFFPSVTVNAASVIHQQWGNKALVIERLLGAGNLTVEHDRVSDTTDGYLCVWWTQDLNVNPTTHFTGTLNLVSQKAGNPLRLQPDTEDAFNKARVNLGERTVYELTSMRAAGALTGAGTVKSSADGAARTLAVGGYEGDLGDATFTGAITGNVTVDGTFGAAATITGNLSFGGNSTLDARAGLLTATGTVTGRPSAVRIAAGLKGSVKVLGATLTTTGRYKNCVFVDEATDASKDYFLSAREDGLYVQRASGFALSLR